MTPTDPNPLDTRRALALLHAASPEFRRANLLFQRAGLVDAPQTHGFYQNYRALRMLVERGWLAKTGERSRREYALTPAGLAERTHTPAPSPGRCRPVCRMCGRPGGHWSGCPSTRRCGIEQRQADPQVHSQAPASRCAGA